LKEVSEKTELKMETIGIAGETHNGLIEATKSLFTDLKIWPLQFSLYYLGQLLNLKKLFPQNSNISFIQKQHVISNLTADWHTSSVRLAGRIFGDFQKRMAVWNETNHIGTYVSNCRPVAFSQRVLMHLVLMPILVYF
jgi:hypothetical protein